MCINTKNSANLVILSHSLIEQANQNNGLKVDIYLDKNKTIKNKKDDVIIVYVINYLHCHDQYTNDEHKM